MAESLKTPPKKHRRQKILSDEEKAPRKPPRGIREKGGKNCGFSAFFKDQKNPIDTRPI